MDTVQNNTNIASKVGLGVGAGLATGGVKYYLDSKKLTGLINDVFEFKPTEGKYAEKVIKQMGKLDTTAEQVEGGLLGVFKRMKTVTETANKTARDAKVLRNASSEAKQAKKLADKAAEQVNLQYKGVAAKVNSFMQQAGKKVNIKTAAIWGAAALVATTAIAAIVSKVKKNKAQAAN